MFQSSHYFQQNSLLTHFSLVWCLLADQFADHGQYHPAHCNWLPCEYTWQLSRDSLGTTFVIKTLEFVKTTFIGSILEMFRLYVSEPTSRRETFSQWISTVSLRFSIDDVSRRSSSSCSFKSINMSDASVLTWYATEAKLWVVYFFVSFRAAALLWAPR